MNNQERKSCASRISSALQIRNMKQTELCELTGIPKSAMSQYIKGSFEPKQDRIYKIAKALDVNEAWLMGFDVPMARYDYQKKNDQLVELIALLRKDNEFREMAQALSQLTPEQKESLKPILAAFTNKQFQD